MPEAAVKGVNHGKCFESVIIASQRDLLRLDRVEQAAKRIGGGKMVPVRGPVDFVGTVCGYGRAIVLDAKMCDLAGRYPVGNRDHLPEHQRFYLIRHGEAGAIAGVLIWATAVGRYFWLDWHALKGLRDTPSIPWNFPMLTDLGSDKFNVDFAKVPGVRTPGAVGNVATRAAS
jgi:hypothetical protein